MDILTCNYEHKLKLHIAHCSIRLLSIGSHIANAKSISCPWEMQDQISQARIYYIYEDESKLELSGHPLEPPELRTEKINKNVNLCDQDHGENRVHK